MKVKNVSRSAKIRVNVQTFRDCALHQWNVRYEHSLRYLVTFAFLALSDVNIVNL